MTATISADGAGARTARATITVTAALGAVGTVENTTGGSEALPPASLPISGLPGTGVTLPGATAQAQLPLLAQDPSIAPGELPAVEPVSLQTKTSPLGLDATSYRLLWTQVAWLTALLVAISMLLTQLRLNRKRLSVRRRR